MTTSRWLAPAVSTVLLVCTVVDAIAHPGHAPKQPGESTPSDRDAPPIARQGSFVAAKDGQIQLRRPDDSLVNVKLSDLSDADLQWVAQRMQFVRQANLTALKDPAAIVARNAMQPLPLLIAQADHPAFRERMPETARAFEAFVKTNAIKTRWDNDDFYVESNGIPDHRMMVGITAWQQQVPIPQKYVGANAWRIPLHPVPAKTPATTKNRFLRGAIAIAVNGIPIFNPLNNRGDDAYLFGELDEFGGHCGRADDYHYHIAPVHLQETIGKDQPIAYALDGYPIYGYQDEKSPDFAPLDDLNGHKDNSGQYHYHATKAYPYLNGGFYGEIVERDGQVDPQPRVEPLRPALPPLRDARITKFEETKPGSYRLTYDVKGKTGTVSYTLHENGSANFEFVDTNGRKTTETYTPRGRGPGGGGNPPARPEGNPPPRGDRPRQKDDRLPEQATSATRTDKERAIEVSSASIDADARLSIDCTCDGKKAVSRCLLEGCPHGDQGLRGQSLAYGS